MTRSPPGSGLALTCAALLWLGWMLACANKKAAQPSGQVQETTAQPTGASATPNTAAIEQTTQQLVAFGQGTIDLATFNGFADGNLGASTEAALLKNIAASCAAHAAGQPRLECINAGLTGQTPSSSPATTPGSGWDAHAQPKQ